MKNSIFSLMLVAMALISQSFTALPIVDEITKPVKESKIVWKAYKVTGAHEGTVNLKSGNLTFDGDQLTGGKFILDMTTIACTDLEGEYKGKLEGHLKSDDFFGAEDHGTSTLTINNVKSTGKNSYEVIANLTLKGITQELTFPVSIYGNKATANLKIDRTKFDIKYGSGTFFDNLKDNVIYDEFDLAVDLAF